MLVIAKNLTSPKNCDIRRTLRWGGFRGGWMVTELKVSKKCFLEGKGNN